MAVAMLEDASRAVACINLRNIAQAQTVPRRWNDNWQQNMMKKILKRPCNPGLVQHAGSLQMLRLTEQIQ